MNQPTLHFTLDIMAAKVLAIAGATGLVGLKFADAFLDAKDFQVRILARSSSINSEKLQGFKSRGASLHPISYDDEASLVNALQGVDVLISTVGAEALLSAQIPLIKAAKAAGVGTFFPSEYGGRFENFESTSPLIQAKQKVVQTAKDVGLPFTVLATGPFPEVALIPPLGYDFANKKVIIWGDADSKITCTTVHSIAEWLTNVLKRVPISGLQNKYFSIQGDLVSGNEIIKLWEHKHQAKLDVEYRSLEEIKERIQADPNDFLAVLIDGWYTGKIHLSPLDNDLYPEWKPQSVESIL